MTFEDEDLIDHSTGIHLSDEEALRFAVLTLESRERPLTEIEQAEYAFIVYKAIGGLVH